MIQVKITDDMRNQAEYAQTKMTELYNHGGLREPDAAYHGVLGELAFKELLERLGKQFNYDHEYESGNPDNGDFTIFTKPSETPVTLDVKTASQPHFVNMLVPKSQKPYPLYVGVRLGYEYAEIWGYCKSTELSADIRPEPKIDNLGIPLAMMHDITNLLEVML